MTSNLPDETIVRHCDFEDGPVMCNYINVTTVDARWGLASGLISLSTAGPPTDNTYGTPDGKINKCFLILILLHIFILTQLD